jgi:hypothetical protein
MKRLILLSVAALCLTVVVGWSTWALFTSVGVSGADPVRPGTLGLKMSDSDEGDKDIVTASFGGSDLKPGDIVGPSTMILKNAGSGQADHVDIKFETTAIDNPSCDAAEPVADVNTILTVTTLTYAGRDLLQQTVPGTFDNADLEAADNGGDNDGAVTLGELKTVILKGLAAPDHDDGVQALTIAVSVPLSAGNGIQGDRSSVTVTFGLFQTAAQHLT